ncbi:MAG: F0F1 ATP synthase subunit A [bacterium]
MKTFSLFGHSFQLDLITIGMTWFVIALMILMCMSVKRSLKRVPGKLQSLSELVYEFISDITLSTLGKKEGKRFLPFILTLFLFILLSNWIGIVPNIANLLGILIGLFHKLLGGENLPVVFEGFTQIKFMPGVSTWYSFLFNIPNFKEPTRSINTDLALALMVFIIVHVNSISKRGIKDYLKQYWGDVIPCHGWWLLLAPVNILMMINIIGEFSSVISHSFRLFGNIFGGFMIIAIVSSVIQHVFIPIGLSAFFGLFAGIIQAFVFTMLAVVYIGQKA